MSRLKNVLNPNYSIILLTFWLLFSNVMIVYPFMDKLSKLIGIFCLVVTVFNLNKIRKSKDVIILLLFFIFNFMSIIINRSNEIYHNIVFFIFMFIFVFNTMEIDFNSTLISKKLPKYYVSIVTIFSILSILSYLFKYDVCINGIYFGLHWKILYGVYLNPNTGGIIALFAFVHLAFLYAKSRDTKLIIPLFINLFYMILADSRGVFISLTTFLFLFFILSNKRFISIKKTAVCIFIYLLATCFFVISSPMEVINTIKDKYIDSKTSEITNIEGNQNNSLINNNSISVEAPSSDKNVDESNLSSEGKGENNQLPQQEHPNTDNKENVTDVKRDVSSARFVLWNAGFNVTKNNLIWGVGKAGQINYLREYLDPNSSAYHIVAGGVHNGYLDLIVSCGIITFSLFMLFILRRVWIFAKNVIKKQINKEYIYSFAVFGAILVNNLVETSFFNAIFITCLIFWISIGSILANESID